MVLYCVRADPKRTSSVGRVLDFRVEEVVGSIPNAGPIKDLKYNDTVFALQMTRPSCCSDEHVKWCSLPGGRHDLVYSILLYVQL